MPTVEFGSRQAANQFRDKVPNELARSDDRRSKTIEFRRDTPERILQRAENQAFTTQQTQRGAAGQRELSDAEIQSLKRQHPTFSWQQHGFQAMRVKAALQRAGATEWMNHYEPGEGAQSALEKFQQSKGRAAGAGGPTATRRADEPPEAARGRQRTQATREMGQQANRAKEPAILEQDQEAVGFLREEQQFGGDIFDISFSGTDPFGRPDPSGQDFQLLQERNEQRSERAQAVDDVKAAPKTRDPLAWTMAPAQLDFPGLDTIDPEMVHEGRSERAQAVDESRDAEIAPDVETWAASPDQFDLPGIDLEREDNGMSFF